MTISDLAQIEGRRYPARRRTQNLAGGVAPIQAKNFSIGNVTLDPNGGQVPWHNQEQEEVYFVVEGTANVPRHGTPNAHRGPDGLHPRPAFFHQLTNIGDDPAAHDLLLRPGRRRGPLAPGTFRHAAAGRSRGILPPLPEGPNRSGRSAGSGGE